jgi:homoserine dehydrogenase
MDNSRETRSVKIGMLGSGTVGEAVQDIILSGQLADKLGISFELARIYTRHPDHKKWYTKHPSLFTTRPEDVTDDPQVDIVLEVLGSQGEQDLPAFKDYIIRSFRHGKSVVTSDKAVLARFGEEIWEAEQKYKQELRFEACVGGGIPIIRSLTNSLSAEDPEAIFGIVNGTCNYILTEMKTGQKSYDVSLREAQERGYAETNPKADTSGMDAEAKLILLAGVTFGLRLEPGLIARQGIEGIHALDFLYADRKGSSTIKHLAVARTANDSIQAFVSPVLVPKDHLLSTIDGITNAMFFKGRRSHPTSDDRQGEPPNLRTETRDWSYAFVGPGAGGGPTAVAVLGDVYELAQRTTNEQPVSPSLFRAGKWPVQPEDRITAYFYVRFIVKDESGIVGDICQIFGGEGINISEVWQLSHSEEELEELAQSYGLSDKPWKILPFVITLEQTTVGQMRKAMTIIRQKDFILVDPIWFPIWRS